MNAARPGAGSDSITIRRPFLPLPAAALSIVFSLVFGYLAVTKAVLPQTTHWTVECTRTAAKVGSCTVTHVSTLYGSPERRPVDLASIQGVSEIAITGKNGKKTGARVVLKTSSGDVDISEPHVSQSNADEVRSDLARFLDDPSQASLSRETQSPTMANGLLMAALFGLFPVAMMLFFATRASKVVVDPARRVVRVASLRTPVSSQTIELSLDAVQRAVVERKQSRRGSALLRVALATAEGQNVGVGMYTNESVASAEKTARAIDEAIARARG